MQVSEKIRENPTGLSPPLTSPLDPLYPIPSKKEGEESGTYFLSHQESPNPTTRQTARIGKYVFSGKLIRLAAKDFDAWRLAYYAIPDLRAELMALDDFYDATLQGDERNRWFVRCSAALDKKHQAAVKAGKQARTQASGYWPMPEKSA